MERRDILKTAFWGATYAMLAPALARAEVHYPTRVDETLWQGINRAKNESNETFLEKVHAPVITVPNKVKAGESFPVRIAIGRVAHPMTPTHWIEHLQLNIGNEPAGNVVFQSHGYCKAEATLHTVLNNELKGKTVSLIVQIKCNLHGIWQNYANVEIV